MIVELRVYNERKVKSKTGQEQGIGLVVYAV